jgi:hypothetical protein
VNILLSGNEAERIYGAIFNRNIPTSVREHFDVLSKKIEGSYSEEEVNKCSEAIMKTRDLEALEVASRYLKKLPLLSEKFKIMVYLAETLPENYMFFVNETQGFISAWISLISSLFRTGYKSVKGMIIIAVHKI